MNKKYSGQTDLLSKINLTKINKNENLNDKYGETFQTNVLKAFIIDHNFFLEIYELLDTQMFSHFHSYIYDIFLKYFQTYNNLPTKEITIQLVNEDKITSDNKKLLIDILNEIFNITIDKSSHMDYYKVTVRKFIRNSRVKTAMIASIKHLEEEDYDSIVTEISGAIKEIGSSKRHGLEFFESLPLLKEFIKREFVPTPFPILNSDKFLKGGFGKKELSAVMGGNSSGKSFFMQTCAAHAIKHNFNVIYYTLEMSEVQVAQRLVSLFLRKYIDKVTDKEIKDIKKIAEDLGITSKFYIQEYPTKTASTLTFKTDLNYRYNHFGFVPDLIIADYDDCMLPTIHYSEKRHEQTAISENLRALASETNTAVLTGYQTNRGGFGKKIVTVENSGESYAKTTVVDFLGSIGRSLEERQAQKGTFFIAKNRNGRDATQFPMIMKLEEGIIDIEDTYYDIDPTEKEEASDSYINEILDNL